MTTSRANYYAERRKKKKALQFKQQMELYTLHNKVINKNARNRAKKFRLDWEPIDYYGLWLNFNKRCQYCFRKVPFIKPNKTKKSGYESAWWHHDIAVAMGGDTLAWNMLCFHDGCSQRFHRIQTAKEIANAAKAKAFAVANPARYQAKRPSKQRQGVRWGSPRWKQNIIERSIKDLEIQLRKQAEKKGERLTH